MTDVIEDGDIALYADFDNRYLRHERRFELEREALTTIPVIDFASFARGSESERKRVASVIRRACIDVGFFYLAGHGIRPADLDKVTEWGHQFFGLPFAEKMEVQCEGPSKPGYIRSGGVNPDSNPDKAADIKERFVMNRMSPDILREQGRQSSGVSKWPHPRVLPGFADFMKSHIKNLTDLSQLLVRAFALSLDLPEASFDEMYEYLSGVYFLNYYPPLDLATLKQNQWSFSPHTDYIAFTLLSQDSVGGLQVRNSAGEWIDVPPIPGTFVVNIGDLLATWTNDLYTSNLHRAANVSGSARLSASFFVSPHGATEVRCLETCQGPDNPPRYAPVLAEQYIRSLIEQADRTGRPGLSVRTAKRLKTR